MERFAVLSDEFGALVPDQLAPLLQSTLGLVRFDALRQARDAGGILAERVDAAQADALVAACKGAGVHAHRVAQQAMVTVGKPVLIRKLGWTDQSLEIVFGYTGGATALPWRGVRLLSAAVLEERGLGPSGPRLGQRRKRKVGFMKAMAFDMLLPGLGTIMSSRDKRRVKREAREDARKGARPTEGTQIEVADCFAADAEGTLHHLRFRGPDLYYGEILGDARQGDPGIDFRQVIAAIAMRASEAVITPAMRALLLPPDVESGEEPLDPSEAEFADEHAFGEYNRWQLQMLALLEG